jgi:hypothetical protein
VSGDEAVHHAHRGGGGDGESFGELVESGVAVAFQDHQAIDALDTGVRGGPDPDTIALDTFKR